jgi:hypothetical protein
VVYYKLVRGNVTKPQAKTPNKLLDPKRNKAKVTNIMSTPFYFLFHTIIASISFYMGTTGDGYIHTFLMCLGAFILGHLVTEALNYVETNEE